MSDEPQLPEPTDEEIVCQLAKQAREQARIKPLKEHLGILDDADDALLLRRMPMAESVLANDIGAEPKCYRNLPPPLKQAVLLKAAHFYWHREPVLVDHSIVALAMGYDDLIAPYRKWVC